ERRQLGTTPVHDRDLPLRTRREHTGGRPRAATRLALRTRIPSASGGAIPWRNWSRTTGPVGPGGDAGFERTVGALGVRPWESGPPSGGRLRTTRRDSRHGLLRRG